MWFGQHFYMQLTQHTNNEINNGEVQMECKTLV